MLIGSADNRTHTHHDIWVPYSPRDRRPYRALNEMTLRPTGPKMPPLFVLGSVLFFAVISTICWLDFILCSPSFLFFVLFSSSREKVDFVRREFLNWNNLVVQFPRVFHFSFHFRPELAYFTYGLCVWLLHSFGRLSCLPCRTHKVKGKSEHWIHAVT